MEPRAGLMSGARAPWKLKWQRRPNLANDALQLRCYCCHRSSGRVAFVLVVEKDCIFHRLGLPQKSRCAMVTGKGMPDLAARAMTWRLATRFKCPVVALTDCNPSGMNVALAYKLACKSSTLPSADEEQFSEPSRDEQSMRAGPPTRKSRLRRGDPPPDRPVVVQRFLNWRGSDSPRSTWTSWTRRPCCR